MQYRKLGELELGMIGLGGEYLEGQDAQAVKDVIDCAIDHGMNVLDIFMSEPMVRTNIGKALKGRREKMFIQGHIGAAFENGQYMRTRNIAACRLAFEDLLQRLQTDYIDFGMIHYIDQASDYEESIANGLFEYAKELQSHGVIRKIGLSTHNPSIALRAVEESRVELLMFSVNPAWDPLEPIDNLDALRDQLHSGWTQAGTGVDTTRMNLYEACAAKGVGITVMKPYGGGILLDAAQSPFGAALTPVQCLHYALERPGVVSVLPGCRTAEEVRQAVAYFDASPAQRAYAMIANSPKYAMTGKCVYCSHCQPCVAQIDIAAITKLYDIARTQPAIPETIRAHYDALTVSAGACVSCGQCEQNCPFGVQIIENMHNAAALFGR